MVDVTSAATIAVCLGSSVIATGGAMTLAVPVTAVIAVAALKAIKKGELIEGKLENKFENKYSCNN